MIDSSSFRAILFDLGGVLVNLDINKTVLAFETLGVKEAGAWIDAGLHTGIFQELEMGAIDEKEFYTGIRQLTNNHISDDLIRQAWCAMLLDFPKERVRLLEKLKKHYPIYLLSNTNVIHHRHFDAYAQDYQSLDDLFTETFYSYQLKDHKPNPSIFEMVLEKIRLSSREVLFIDDALANVQTAESLGMPTIHITKKQTLEDHFQRFTD
jgi:putative hydrolase of the HAD superfamily